VTDVYFGLGEKETKTVLVALLHVAYRERQKGRKTLAAAAASHRRASLLLMLREDWKRNP